MIHHFSQRLRTTIVVIAIITSEAINAVRVDVTAEANTCNGSDAIKQVSITFTSPLNTNHNYSFGCEEHEADYPSCHFTQLEQNSAIIAVSSNDTCGISDNVGMRFGRSYKNGRCYRICDSCGDKPLNSDDTTADDESIENNASGTAGVSKSKRRQTCIEEKHTAEYIIKNRQVQVSNEGCKWKEKCEGKKNGTSSVEKAIGMRLAQYAGNRISAQLYCCKMNCSYNCTEDKFVSIEGETIADKLNKSEVLTEIQVQKHRKGNGRQMYTVVLNKCNECPPGFAAPVDPPPAIPVPVLAIGYEDEPIPPFVLCDPSVDKCVEGHQCIGICQRNCLSEADCAPPTPFCLAPDAPFCSCSGTKADCTSSGECCSGQCIDNKCAISDGSCTNQLKCFDYYDRNGNNVQNGLCINGQCT